MPQVAPTGADLLPPASETSRTGLPRFWLRLHDVWNLLRLSPFDSSSDEGRQKERLRLVAWGTVTAALAKLANGVTMIVGVAATARYLDHERFGLWMTFFAALALMNVANFGINNGALNAVSAARQEGDAAIRGVIANCFSALALVSLALAVLFFALFPFLNWASLLNVAGAQARAETGAAVAVFAACFLLNNLVSVIQRIEGGLQLNWLGDIWGISGQILATITILVIAHFRGGLPWLILAACGCPALAWGFNCIDFFLRTHRRYRPKWKDLDRTQLRHLLNVGGLFVLLDLAYLAGNATDTLVIARELGVAAVAGYAVALKLTQGLGLSQLFMLPLWPAFGDALTRGEHAWARRVLSRALLVAVGLSAGAAAVILIAGAAIIRVWSGRTVVLTSGTIPGFALWAVVAAVSGTLAVFLNNKQYLRVETAWYVLASLAALVSSVLLTAGWRNPAGAVWGRALSYGILFIGPSLWLIYYPSGGARLSDPTARPPSRTDCAPTPATPPGSRPVRQSRSAPISTYV